MKKSSAATLVGLPWDFSQLFNEAIRSLPERPMMKRDYLWASEIGGDAYSRYLKMWAHKQTNPPNERSRRKFVMGHVTEWIVGLILTVTGVLKSKQLRGEVQLPGLLKVSGKLDFIAGGLIDWEKAKEEIKKINILFQTSFDDIPPIIKHSIDHIFRRMEMMFSLAPLREYVLECKSCSGQVMELIQRTKMPRPRHPMQPLHYLLANKMPEAVLLYVSKDDALMEQFLITPTKELLKDYRDDVKMMTECYNASGPNYMKNLPPKEPEILFNEKEWRFWQNMNVRYSNYLTMGWGYKSQDEFKERWDKPIASFNRVFKRVVNGDNLTAANKIVIEETKKYFPLYDKYVAKAKAAGAFQNTDENEEEE